MASAKPIKLMWDNRQTSAGDRFHQPQARPVCERLLGDVVSLLTLYFDNIVHLGKDLKVLGWIKQKLMSLFSTTYVGGVMLVLAVGVTLDSTKGTVTIAQDNHAKFLLGQHGMASCNSAYTPGVGKGLSFEQPEKKLLNKDGKQRFQTLTASVMHPGQVSQY